MVPAHPLIRALAAAAIACAALAACGDDEPPTDPAAFCDAVETLRRDDPFAELALATPDEMRDAFADLHSAAETIAGAAPADTAVQARRYLDAVAELSDQLAAAGYDPRAVDTLAYTDATAEYTDAARSLDNTADATCA